VLNNMRTRVRYRNVFKSRFFTPSLPSYGFVLSLNHLAFIFQMVDGIICVEILYYYVVGGACE